VIGVGIDIVEIDRFRRVLARRPRVADRVFSPREREALAGRFDPIPSLAARFAAKEAAMKAMRVGIGAVGFAELEVVPGPEGAPRLAVSGRAAARAGSLGVSGFELSLSHTESLATAVVIAH